MVHLSGVSCVLFTGNVEIRHKHTLLEDYRHPYGFQGSQTSVGKKYHN